MKTLILIFTLFSPKSWAGSCETVDLKIIFDKKEIIAKETLCPIKTSDNMLFYVSKSCTKKGCEILKRNKKNLEVENYSNNFGSPGFKICTALGGVPQIFEFKSAKNMKWESTERCLFSSKDFVEISYLVREWKEFLK